MKHLLFYTTAGCHLCEIAITLIQQTLDAEMYQIDAIEISDSDVLVDLYGIRIPVLADPDSKAELGWPFDQQKLRDFIDQ
ncbi:MAG: glutaredoxin family protein [Motiliproteus sp.]